MAEDQSFLSGGLAPMVQRLLTTLVALLHNRVELLGIEFEEEKRRLLRTMAWGAAAILLSVVALVFVALFITVLLWDSHRLLALGLVSLGFVLAGVLAWWQVRRSAHASGTMLAASLDELLRDYAALTGRQVAEPGQPPSHGASR